MSSASSSRRSPSAAILVAFAAGVAATPALACDVTAPTGVSGGTYSSAALQANAAYVRTDGSFTCPTAPVLTLLSGDSLKATLAAGTAMTLTGTGTAAGGTMTVKLAADAAGNNQLLPGKTVTYLDGTVLSLLDNGAMKPAIFVSAKSAGDLPAGTYSGTFAVRWDWSMCTAALACALGNNDKGSKTASITITVTVSPKPAAVVVAYRTTWSPTSSTNNPKAVPGAKVRVAATITNPDVVALDGNTLAVVIATPSAMRLALEGDGTVANGSVETAQGAKASGLTLAYAAPASTTDDVDFSSDGGATWTFAPVAGDATSQGAVTAVRFRPQGRMAAQSSFAISLPYVVK